MTGLLYVYAFLGAAIKFSIAQGALTAPGQDEAHVKSVLLCGLVCDAVVGWLTAMSWHSFTV